MGAFLLVIVLSWVLSAGTSSYVAYQRIRALRREMLKNPQSYPVPIPEPGFGVMDFLLGPRPGLQRPGGQEPPPNGRDIPPPWMRSDAKPRHGQNPNAPKVPYGPPPAPKGPPPDSRREGDGTLRNLLIVRIAVALILAVVAGKWLSSKFSRRLDELAAGAKAFDGGNLRHRIPQRGEDEFAQVAAAMNTMAERVSGQIERLEDDANKRRQFLADVAHELRSPVATLRTMAGALDDGIADDPDRRKRAIESLVRTSERLLHLVADLLELARLDLKELPIHPRGVELRVLAANAIESLTACAAQAKVTLNPLEQGQPVHGWADPDRLAQVLHNILDNSISHAGEGSEVRIEVLDDPPRIRITDNGRGIPEEHLANVFEPFYRVDTARTPAQGHSGLGLRICRGLVEAQNGQLALTSEEGKGVCVEITLPGSQPDSSG